MLKAKDKGSPKESLRRGPILTRLFSVTAMMTFLVASLIFIQNAEAAGTTAGTLIGNQATATYRDPANNPFTTDSNLVETEVEKVYGLVITPTGTEAAPGQSRQGTPGSIVYFFYEIENTGNTPEQMRLALENFTDAATETGGQNIQPGNARIFWDQGIAGLDAGDPLVRDFSAGPALGVDLAYTDSQTPIGGAGGIAPDARAKVIVEVRVPTGAASGNTIKFDLGAEALDLAGAQVDGDSGTAGVQPVLDDKNVGGAATGNHVSQITVNNDAVVTITKSVDKVTADPGETLTYTFIIANNGNAPADNVVLIDEIPANTQFLGNATDGAGLTSPSGFFYSNNASGVDTLYQDASSTSVRRIKYIINTDLDPDGAGGTAAATGTAGNGLQLAAGASRTITFQVTILSTAPVGDIDNQAVFSYEESDGDVVGNPDDDIPNAGDPLTTIATTTINTKSAVTIEPADETPSTPGDEFDNDVAAVSGYAITTDPANLNGVTDNRNDSDGADNDAGTPADVQMIAADSPAGSYAYFRHLVKNDGNASDIFNISLDVAGSTLPTGGAVNVEFFNAANTQALLDTNTTADGIPDTSPVAAGGTVQIVVRLFIPATETAVLAAAEPKFKVKVVATSTNGGSARGGDPGETTTDASEDWIKNIQEPGVTLYNYEADDTNGVDAGTVPDPTDNSQVIETASANGTTVTFPLQVENNGSVSDTFDLTSNGILGGVQYFDVPQVPTQVVSVGLTDDIITVVDATGIVAGDTIVVNGETLTVASVAGNVITTTTVPATTPAAGDPVTERGTTPLTDTGVLAPNGTKDIIAVVTVPVNTTPGNYDPVFTATSNNNGTKNDVITDRIIVPNFRDFTITTDRNGETVPDGTIFYTHTITNTGNVEENFNLAVASQAPNPPQFVYTLLDPANGNAPISNKSGVAVGASFDVIVRVQVPAGTPTSGPSSVDLAIITATELGDNNAVGGTGGDLDVAKTNTDTTSVIEGFVGVVKAVRNVTKGETAFITTGSTAEPGDTLEYRVIVTNNGSQNATNVIVTDAIPTYTTYTAGTLQINGNARTDLDDTEAGAISMEAKYTAGTDEVTYYVGTGANGTTGGTITPSQSVTLLFRVTVD